MRSLGEWLLPVATLVQRARNAKSPRDRLLAALRAWDVSVRLQLAECAPGNLMMQTNGPLAAWTDTSEDVRLDAPELQALWSLLTKGSSPGGGRPTSPQPLFDAVGAYWRRILLEDPDGPTGLHEDATALLLEGLERLWDAGVFGTGRLLYKEASTGRVNGRLLELRGEAADSLPLLGDETPEFLPGRVYRERGDGLRSLHPWVLYRLDDLREQVFFFTGTSSFARYSDFVSGEALQGSELEEAFPGLQELVASSSPSTEVDVKPPGEPGDFEVLGQLGVGGMGVVHLARQRSLDRLVALKLLSPAAVRNPSSVERFEREVAALSRCDHPHVVKILATGRMEGTPYYAMEYVEGADLAAVARELPTSQDLAEAVARAARPEPEAPPDGAQRLPGAKVQQLVVAFRDAARGLHHLHDHGVVHRDVKPGNLMITVHDGRIVVMDLGLALLEDSDWSLTRERSRILGTLRYMAPEQLRGSPRRVDRRADIYSLGAVFYELLTGHVFLDGVTEVQLIEQVLRQPPIPPKKVVPDLPVDLDTILRKAIEKDPRFRYETADALARDLDHWLHGRPIAARPPALRYVAGLALRRHRTLAWTLGLSIVALVAITVGFLVALARERERAMARAAEAERERARAEELASFMLFDLRDGLKSIDRLDLMGKVARKARDYYASLSPSERDPERESRHASALAGLADVLEAQGALPDALAATRAALSIRRRLVASDPVHALELAASLGQLGRLLGAQGDLDAAIASFEEARSGLGELTSDPSVARRARKGIAALSLDIGRVLHQRGDLAGAAASFASALETARELVRADPQDQEPRRDVLVALTNVGDVHLARGDRPAALHSYREALEVALDLIRAAPADAARQRDAFVCQLKIGDVLKAQGNSEKALEHYRAGRGVAEDLVRRDPTNTHWQRDLFVTHEILGDMLLDQGDAGAAMIERRAALSIAETLARHDPSNTLWQGDLASSHQRLGELQFAIGEREAARDAFKQALEIRTQLTRKAPADTRWRRELAMTYSHLGECHLVSGALDDASSALGKALEIREQLVQENARNASWRHDFVLSLSALGEVEMLQGRAQAALERHHAAVQSLMELVQSDPTNHPWRRSLAVEHGKVGGTLLALGRLEAAARAHQAGLDILNDLAAKDPSNAEWRRDLSIAHDALADVRQAMGDHEGALVHRRLAVESHRPLVEQAPHFESERVYLEGKLRATEILAGVREAAGPEDFVRLALARYEAGEYERAAECFAEALTDPSLRADLDRSVLYNAACAAALVQGEGAVRWHQQGVDWLREDLERRRARVRALEESAAGSQETEPLVAEARKKLVAHIEWAREGDPDLVSLRSLSGFAGLFEEQGDAGGSK